MLLYKLEVKTELFALLGFRRGLDFSLEETQYQSVGVEWEFIEFWAYYIPSKLILTIELSRQFHAEMSFPWEKVKVGTTFPNDENMTFSVLL